MCRAQLVQPYAAAQALASKQWMRKRAEEPSIQIEVPKDILCLSIPGRSRGGARGGRSTLMPKAKARAVEWDNTWAIGKSRGM